jgi:DNA-binding response OmpR family regulator
MNEQKMPIVVIADNDEDVAQAMRAAFRMAGFEAHRVANSQDCIAKIKEIGGNRVDAIAIDGALASGGGTQLILNIRSIDKDINIFVLAERYLEETKTRVLDYGANEFMIKPCSMSTLIDKVKVLLLEQDPAARHAGAKA